MKTGEVKADAEGFMPEDGLDMVETSGEITEGKRGRPRGSCDENEHQSCEEADCSHEGSEGIKKYCRRGGRIKRLKKEGVSVQEDVDMSEDIEDEDVGFENVRTRGNEGMSVEVIENGEDGEEGLKEEQDDVGTKENGKMSVEVREDICNVRESEKSEDLAPENGGPASAVEERGVMEGVELKVDCNWSNELKVKEEEVRVAKKEGYNSKKVNSKVVNEGRSSRVVRQSSRITMEKIEKLSSELKMKEDDGLSRSGKGKGGKKKKNVHLKQGPKTNLKGMKMYAILLKSLT